MTHLIEDLYSRVAMKQYLLAILLVFSANSMAEDKQADKRQISSQEPESGTIVFPVQQNQSQERQCLTVCQQWGEECTFIATTGSRQCRRVCKSLGQECF